MKAPAGSTAPRSSRRGFWNVVLLLSGAGAVWAVLASQPDTRANLSDVPGAAAVSGGAMDALSLLDLIPQSRSESASENLVTATLSAVRARPDHAPGWISLGDALAQRQRETGEPVWFELARKIYEEASRKDPAQVDAMAGMAWAYGGQHQFELSLLWAGKALEADSSHATSHGITGDAWVELGEYEKALESYQKMMDLRPDLSSWSRGAHLLWLTGQQNRAVLLMKQAVNSGGPFAENTAWCRARLAMMLFQNGALLAASQALEPALGNAKPNRLVLLAAGRIAAAQKKWDVAETHYRAVLESGPDHEALVALGDLAMLQARADEAKTWYDQVQALHLSHKEKGVHDHLGMARFLADHERTPGEALRLALEHGEPRNLHEWDTLAWVWLKQGDPLKAAGYIKKSLDTGTRDAEIHYHAGCIAMAAGDLSTARQYLQKSLSLNPAFSLLQAPEAHRLLEKSQPAPMALPPSLPVHAPQPRPLTRLR